MPPQFTPDRLALLKELLASSKQLSLEVGGTIGEDLNSCIKSLGRLAERLNQDWETIWHKGTTEFTQQKKAKIVCIKLNEVLWIILDLIDHKSSGKLAATTPFSSETGLSLATTQPHPTDSSRSVSSLDVSKSGKAPAQRMVDPIHPKLQVNKQATNSAKPVVESHQSPPTDPTANPPVFMLTESLATKKPVLVESSSAVVLPKVLPRLPVTITRQDCVPLVIVEKEKYVEMEQSRNEALTNVDLLERQITIQRLQFGKAEKEYKTAKCNMERKAEWSKKRIESLDVAINSAVVEKRKLKRSFDAQAKLIGDISREALFEQLPDGIRSRVRRVVLHDLLDVLEKANPGDGVQKAHPGDVVHVHTPRRGTASAAASHESAISNPPALTPQNMTSAGSSEESVLSAIIKDAEPKWDANKSTQDEALSTPRRVANRKTTIQDGAIDLEQSKAPKVPKYPKLQIPSEIGTRPFICFVCGVVVTDPSSTLSDPETIRANFAKMNSSQLEQLSSMTNLGEKGVAVVCKEHTVDDWLLHLKKQDKWASLLERKQQQLQASRKRSHEEEVEEMASSGEMASDEVSSGKKAYEGVIMDRTKMKKKVADK